MKERRNRRKGGGREGEKGKRKVSRPSITFLSSVPPLKWDTELNGS